MTLSTVMVFKAETDVEKLALEAYEVARHLLGTPHDYRPEREVKGDVVDMSHQPMMGLPAWLLMKWRPAGPTAVPFEVESWMGTDEEELTEYREMHESHPWDSGSATIHIDWDTAYGYRGPNNESCSDLHARYVAVLAAWAEHHGIECFWRNEFTGEWFKGTAGLDGFGRSFDSPGGAGDWFHNMVLPVIKSMGGEVV